MYKRVITVAKVFVVAVLGFVLVFSDNSWAMDTQFMMKNEVLFLDAAGGSCSASGGSLGSAPTSLTGDGNPHKVWNYLTARGLSPIAAAGVLGNIEAESTFDPFVENEIGAFGLIQWLGGRAATIKQKLAEGGVTSYTEENNDKALLIELNWMWEEAPTQVPGDYPFWEKMNAEQKVGGDLSIKGDGYMDDGSVDLAENARRNEGNGSTLLFHAVVERSSMEGMQKRIASAEGYMELYGTGGASSDCSVSEGGLTADQAKMLMEYYKTGDSEADELVRTRSLAASCSPEDTKEGWLGNCTSFTAYFILKFAPDLQMTNGHGSAKAGKIAAANGIETSDTPSPFAIFSHPFTAMQCDFGEESAPCGHTGVILGIHGDEVIIGEANCEEGYAGIRVVTKSLSEISGAGWTFMPTSGHLQQNLIMEAIGA